MNEPNMVDESLFASESVAEVTILHEVLPPLTSTEIAQKVFEKLTETKVYETVLDIQKLTAAILEEHPTTDPEDIDATIKILVRNGYVEQRRSGKKKHPRWSIAIDQATKQEVLSDIESGSFEEGLRYMFQDKILAEVPKRATA